ncbi:hypothetical protein SAMD00019534_075700 [Acytostelium subglobosum LB1]|uniref:hypothetical protein n=1 Tax=Acytostelium subglobosum LB1 TaxID=1410327 RepID=UPI0006449A6B|nr:hypothetical protein SAMD00019534_075700 [Acytostelium subglobosum LB1]GAM24395.1 hypothetical protein SAMD00019534_075700 [Acytostelium subglobosum LB1]|eukprot:XP_012752721.1 hypothetical protein SAMD00019534_075700 [Acytostelium subglobosum LB1]
MCSLHQLEQLDLQVGSFCEREIGYLRQNVGRLPEKRLANLKSLIVRIQEPYDMKDILTDFIGVVGRLDNLVELEMHIRGARGYQVGDLMSFIKHYLPTLQRLKIQPYYNKPWSLFNSLQQLLQQQQQQHQSCVDNNNSIIQTSNSDHQGLLLLEVMIKLDLDMLRETESTMPTIGQHFGGHLEGDIIMFTC